MKTLRNIGAFFLFQLPVLFNIKYLICFNYLIFLNLYQT